MEEDALTVESVDMNWELESSTIEEVDFKYVRFNDIVDVSFVEKAGVSRGSWPRNTSSTSAWCAGGGSAR